MTIYSYTRLDGERVVIDTGVAPLLVDVTNWFDNNCSCNNRGTGHYAAGHDHDCKEG